MRKWKVAALAAAGAVALAGCTAGGDGVATLDGDAAAETAAQTQADRARALAECLVEAGVPAVAEPWGDTPELAWVGIETGEPYAMSLGGGDSSDWRSGAGAKTDDQKMADLRLLAPLVAKYNEAEAETMPGSLVSNTSASDPGAPPYLVIGEEDFSTAFTACLDSSGYTRPEPIYDPAEELRAEHFETEAIIQWIGCARENGFPNMKEPPPPVADERKTYPVALVPRETTPADLGALLEACPTFDPDDVWAVNEAVGAALAEDDFEAAKEVYERAPEDYPGHTQVRIEVELPPEYQGRSMDGTWDKTLLNQIEALHQVFREDNDAFIAAQEGAGR
ncbi:MAG: hypothetical protein LBL01_05670 [Bifidobacteriaceae bacterium]|jgi:hypothetical protein|nr:hypothetical protein [Bifidobacteriaceae bacterium]